MSLQAFLSRSAGVARPLLILSVAVLLFWSCAPAVPPRQFIELLGNYPPTPETLRIPELSASASDAASRKTEGRDVVIMVHPAYALFFRESQRSRYSPAKYYLMRMQLEQEEQAIRELAASGTQTILILPGNYERESIAPRSYTAYLNNAAGESASIHYLFSESWSSGDLTTEGVVVLYRFLQTFNPRRILIGGGFIGRCQREFYNQLTSYMEGKKIYLIPELSSLSPDDITDEEALDILEHLRDKDYGPVRKRQEEMNKDGAAILSFPLSHEL